MQTAEQRYNLLNLLGSEVRLSPRMLGLGMAFGDYRKPYLVGRLQNVDSTYAYLDLSDGRKVTVFIHDIFEVRKA